MKLLGLVGLLLALASPAKAACTSGPGEDALWRWASNSEDPHRYKIYAKKFPQGCYIEDAKVLYDVFLKENISVQQWGRFRGGREFTAPGGQWLTPGRDITAERMAFTVDPQDAKFVSLDLNCDGAGVNAGQSGWTSGPCPRYNIAPIQGFQVRTVGPNADLYDLDVRCVIEAGAVGLLKEEQVGNGGWCGGITGNPYYIRRFFVKITRQPIEK